MRSYNENRAIKPMNPVLKNAITAFLVCSLIFYVSIAIFLLSLLFLDRGDPGTEVLAILVWFFLLGWYFLTYVIVIIVLIASVIKHRKNSIF
jgi:hypothetical protein